MGVAEDHVRGAHPEPSQRFLQASQPGPHQSMPREITAQGAQAGAVQGRDRQRIAGGGQPLSQPRPVAGERCQPRVEPVCR